MTWAGRERSQKFPPFVLGAFLHCPRAVHQINISLQKASKIMLLVHPLFFATILPWIDKGPEPFDFPNKLARSLPYWPGTKHSSHKGFKTLLCAPRQHKFNVYQVNLIVPVAWLTEGPKEERTQRQDNLGHGEGRRNKEIWEALDGNRDGKVLEMKDRERNLSTKEIVRKRTQFYDFSDIHEEPQRLNLARRKMRKRVWTLIRSARQNLGHSVNERQRQQIQNHQKWRQELRKNHLPGWVDSKTMRAVLAKQFENLTKEKEALQQEKEAKQQQKQLQALKKSQGNKLKQKLGERYGNQNIFVSSNVEAVNTGYMAEKQFMTSKEGQVKARQLNRELGGKDENGREEGESISLSALSKMNTVFMEVDNSSKGFHFRL